jgi:hypothetical protein
MNDTLVVTYEQLQPQLFLSARPSATKHGPNSWLNDLMVCYIERDIFKGLDLQKIKKAFQKKKDRQMKLPQSPRRNYVYLLVTLVLF